MGYRWVVYLADAVQQRQCEARENVRVAAFALGVLLSLKRAAGVVHLLSDRVCDG